MIEKDDNDVVAGKNPIDFYVGAKVEASKYGAFSFKGIIRASFFDNEDELQYVVEALPGVTLFQVVPTNFVVTTIDHLKAL